MSKAVYLGINTEFPIYETTTQEVNIPFNADNIDSIFHTTVTGNAFIKGVFTTVGAVTGISFNVDRDYSLTNGTTVTYKEILTALYDINNVQIFFEGAVKSGYTALKVGSTSYTITAASSKTPVFSGNITAGTTIELTGYFYYSDFMPTAGYFGITADDIADTEEITNIVGYEQKEVARKVTNIYCGTNEQIAKRVIKGYIGDKNNIARKFYSNIASFFSYTGDYTESSVEIEGAPHTLYALTSSGELKVEGENIQFWMCGGGGGGGAGYVSGGTTYCGAGGGGGYVLQNTLPSGEYAIVIGAGGSAVATGSNSGMDGGETKIGDVYSVNGGSGQGNGGSGGGGSGRSSSSSYVESIIGNGAGISTLPFGIVSLEYHSAGGGAGGGYYYTSTRSAQRTGGNGGSNGSNATAQTSGTSGGTGGSYGGGTGGNGATTSYNATAGSFYGAGGGGGGTYYRLASSSTTATQRKGSGGSGYQGIVYIAIPA